MTSAPGSHTPAPAVPASGSLADTPLARLLLELHAARYSGALALRRGRVEKKLQLQDGEPVAADSNLPAEGLTRGLVQQGLLPAEALERVEGFVASRGCKEEAALVALQLLPPTDLVRAIRDQNRRRLLECFAWGEGEFQLDGEAPAAPGNAAFRLDPVALVRDGLVAHWPPDRMLADLAGRLAHFPERTARFASVAQRLEPSSESSAVLSALDESCVTGETLRQGSSPATLATLWVLAASGALHFRESPPGSEAAAEAEKPAEPCAAETTLEIVIRGREASRPGPETQRSRGGRKRSQTVAAERKAAELHEEVLDKHQQLGQLDHYALLGLARNAKPAEVKRAYLLAAKRFHPDALARLGLGALNEQANEVFAEIVRAHDVLADSGHRADYDASLAGESTADMERVAQAEKLFRKGEILVRAGNFAGAVDFLEAAVEIWPEDPAYQGTLGWALSRKNPPDLERAALHLEKALALEPDDRETAQRLDAVRRECAKKPAG